MKARSIKAHEQSVRRQLPCLVDNVCQLRGPRSSRVSHVVLAREMFHLFVLVVWAFRTFAHMAHANFWFSLLLFSPSEFKGSLALHGHIRNTWSRSPMCTLLMYQWGARVTQRDVRALCNCCPVDIWEPCKLVQQTRPWRLNSGYYTPEFTPLYW